MANRFNNVQLSTGRIALIIGLIVAVCVLVFLRNAPTPPSTQPHVQPAQQQKVNQLARCIYNSVVPASSPLCPPHIMLGNGPMLISSLSESGVCSVEEAKKLPVVTVDFTRYIGSSTIADPGWRVQVGNGTTVALPTTVYDLIRILSLEFPNDDQLTYAISSDSYESLKKSIPSLGSTMASIGLATETHYVTSHRCLPLAPIPE